MITNAVSIARRVLAERRRIEDGRDKDLVHLPAHARIDLNRVLAASTRDSCQQVIAVPREPGDHRSFEHEVWREVARSGRRCERLYVLPHQGHESGWLNEQLALDSAAGMSASTVVVSRIPFDDPLKQIQGLWILDNETVVLLPSGSTSGGPESTLLTVSARESDVSTSRDAWSRLNDWAGLHSHSNAVELEEPLSLSADLLNGVARVFCRGDHVDRGDCSWYHGSWQYLRLLELVSTPTWHDEFYDSELRKRLSRQVHPVVMVTGTADYSMLAYILKSAASLKAEPEIHVLDLCPTPLFACNWYAKHSDSKISCWEQDIFALNGVALGRCDLICTDAFLTRFDATQTDGVLATWNSLLKIGGSVLTTVRVHSLTNDTRTVEEAITDFRDRALQRARRWEPFISRSATEIAELAETYAHRMLSNRLGDERMIRVAFEKAGFAIRRAELGSVPGELYPTVYLRIAAEKQVACSDV